MTHVIHDLEPQEEWRPVPGYDGFEASSLGRIRLPAFDVPYMLLGVHAVRSVKSRVTLGSNSQGYRVIRLGRSASPYFIRVRAHRLVCLAFHGLPPTALHEVAHGNGVRSDNRPGNLRWATRSENHADKVGHGTHNRGEKNHQAIVSDADVAMAKLEIMKARRDQAGRLWWGEATKIARKTGVPVGVIHRASESRGAWKHVAPAAGGGISP